VGLRAPNISAFKVTSDNFYCFYIDFSPLIHELWTILCDSGLARTAQMRALKHIQEHVISQCLQWPLPIFTVFTWFLPLIDEFWTILCDSGLVRMAWMRALKQCGSVLHSIHDALPILCLNFHFILFLFSCFYSIWWSICVSHVSWAWLVELACISRVIMSSTGRAHQVHVGN